MADTQDAFANQIITMFKNIGSNTELIKLLNFVDKKCLTTEVKIYLFKRYSYSRDQDVEFIMNCISSEDIINMFKLISSNTELINYINNINKKYLTNEIKTYLFKRYIDTQDQVFGKVIMNLIMVEQTEQPEQPIQSVQIDQANKPQLSEDIMTTNISDNYIVVNKEVNMDELIAEYIKECNNDKIDFKRLLELISQGVDVNTSIKNRNNITILHLAVLHNISQYYLDIILGLKGINLETKDDNDFTALQRAIYINSTPEIINKLIKAGANVNAKSEKFSILNIAIYTGNIGIIKLLLEAGADPTYICGDNDLTTFTKNIKYDGDTVNEICNLLKTHLNKQLLDILNSDKDIDYDKIKTLIECGADPEVKNKYNSTILHFASQDGNNDIIKLFVEKGLNLNKINSDNCFPLLLAIVNWYNTSAELLIKGGADVNLLNYKKETVLYSAIRSKNEEGVKLLIDNGAKVFINNFAFQSPLDVAYDPKYDKNQNIINLLKDALIVERNIKKYYELYKEFHSINWPSIDKTLLFRCAYNNDDHEFCKIYPF